MLRHAIAPLRRYTKASHDVVQHPRLNSDAKILLVYVQGLPEGSTARPLSAHAERLGIKGRAYQKAKQLLTACGFFHQWRHQDERGHWVTDQLLANVHLTPEAATGIRDGDVPSAHMRTVGEPTRRVVGGYLPADKNGEKNTPHPPHQAHKPEEAPEPEPAQDPERTVAERVLLSLRHTRRELHLGEREARTLSEKAADWLRRGISPADLHHALTSALPPSGVRTAVGFLRHRLTEKMPEQMPQEHAAPAPGPPDTPQPPPRPHPLTTCEGPGPEHVFRPLGDETHCGPCRQEQAWEAHHTKHPPLAPEAGAGAVPAYGQCSGW
ncbi:hypothetical protein [Streptomyces sp. H27-C3]|uniref:hypothetical protein n=1 Tax=Streptomyces sp. H27-C3 TaxID=3046305 RepID=UPI0024B940A1|nr:hypothetical protein [Streptomyces sp. H27-C3]MDJ0460397.1 hypothetical protein [Streptomyces sp. H27-C3]